MQGTGNIGGNGSHFFIKSNQQNFKTENNDEVKGENNSDLFPPTNNGENLEIKNDDEVKDYELDHQTHKNDSTLFPQISSGDFKLNASNSHNNKCAQLPLPRYTAKENAHTECNAVSNLSIQEERVFNILNRNPAEAWKYIHNKTSIFGNDKLLKTLYYCLTPKAIQRLNMRIHNLCTKIEHVRKYQERRTTKISSLRKPDNIKIIKKYNGLNGIKQEAFKRDVLKVTTTTLSICGEDWQTAQILLNNLQTRAKPPITPDTITYNAALKVSARSGNINEVLRLRQEMKDKGILPDTATYATVISAYKITGNIDEALRLLQEMKDKGIRINETTYNTVISVCITNGNAEVALRLLQEMKDNETLKPDEFTYNATLASCATGQQWPAVVNLFQEMVDKQIPQDDVARSTAINACIKVGQLQKALDLIYMMGKNFKPDTTIYSVAIAACIQDGEWEIAWQFFIDMEEKKIPKNILIYNAIVSVFAQAGKLKEASNLIKQGIQDKVYRPRLGVYKDALGVTTLDLHEDKVCVTTNHVDDLHEDKIFISRNHVDYLHIAGIPLLVAKTIFMMMYDENHINIDQVIVGQHGKDTLQNGMLEFIREQGLDVYTDPANKGKLIIIGHRDGRL